METYLQYRRIGQTVRKQLESDAADVRQLPCLSRQETRVVGGRQVLVVDWDGPDDPHNPRNWPFMRRFNTTIIITGISFMVGLAAPIDSAVLPQAAADFGVSEVVETMAVGLFLIGFGVGALICGPFSEVLGRSMTYLVSLACMCIFLMASALAPNIGAQLAFRFIAGFCGASPLVCAGGSVSDMFTALEKTYMFPIFSIGGFGGAAAGPIMGAWIPQSPYLHTWRWTEWVALLSGGLILSLTFLFQPETYHPVILSWKAAHLRKITGDKRYYAAHELERTPLLTRLRIALPRPFEMAFREPVILLITLYMSVLYIILFTFFDGYEYIYTRTYGISQGLTNTIFVGIFVGIWLASVWMPWVYKKTVEAQRRAEADGLKQFDPEIRLWFAMLGGAPAIPISLFWMAWTSYPSISIWSPIMASVLFGYGTVLIFISSYMYLIDTYESWAASALTFVTLARYCCAGGMTIVGIPFYRNMGHHWTLTILGCLSLLLTPIPYVFYKYGHIIRKNSRFAVTRSVEEAEEVEKPVQPDDSGSSSATIPIEQVHGANEEQGTTGVAATQH
ncbi:hypothetical protein A1O1_05520 [Capronia coronata CBS 617.96]|uniref:Major facilitator superfamily (MFS) profile domain-containing protein n=1 Tax=Capronia coronata CBS 617.96 TaxID=1182541 RepID=W9YFZ3_9EURO|nr:uncharacterized protein A1O1_05520 [Capronia coronata CBS 617.96]EXJ88590.1 hypothetical protein A1O1_05520 [Capronia coronata CBS 617.96]